MKITAIRPQKRHPERVNVHVDGEFRLALPRELVLQRGLRVEGRISEGELAELGREDLLWKAREASLGLLSYRPRTSRELQRRLVRKDFPEDVAASTVEELAEKGLVDDAAFSESFVRDRLRFRPRGRRRLVQELRAKGVTPETAEASVGAVLEQAEVTEIDLARQAAARFAPRAGEDPRRARRRLHAFLARRGFGSAAIREVLDELHPGR